MKYWILQNIWHNTLPVCVLSQYRSIFFNFQMFIMIFFHCNNEIFSEASSILSKLIIILFLISINKYINSLT